MVSINWMVYDFICADATRWGGLRDLGARAVTVLRDGTVGRAC